MENASRALIMAGSMLIGVLLLSLLVYFWGILGEYNKNVLVSAEDRMAVTKYNNALLAIDMGQFDEIYDEVKNPKDDSVRSTVSDLITAINKARDVGIRNGNDWITDIKVEYNSRTVKYNAKTKDFHIKIYNLINDGIIKVQNGDELNIKHRTGVSIDPTSIEHDALGRISSIKYIIKEYKFEN